MILEEFENTKAVINPEDLRSHYPDFKEVCDVMIMPFSGVIVDTLIAQPESRHIGNISNINGLLPVYIYEKSDIKVAFCLAPLGAPSTVGMSEELHALGFEKFIYMGSCGVLDRDLEADKIVLPTSAVRDEGTSYHYSPASDEIDIKTEITEKLTDIFKKNNIGYVLTKAWTTDAFFRETPAKVKRRLESGVQVVDMECSAITAWSQFRNLPAYQFFYTADFVNHEDEVWEERKDERQEDVLVFWDIALKIAKEI